MEVVGITHLIFILNNMSCVAQSNITVRYKFVEYNFNQILDFQWGGANLGHWGANLLHCGGNCPSS